ncbi:AMP-binding protein [Streptomyces sp. NPDC008125]|uniref:AMP-binding protein n=1 Tax=Streptomyces sp. NPDC008125 TaxID=3364811 RepID=UPI0036EFF382
MTGAPPPPALLDGGPLPPHPVTTLGEALVRAARGPHGVTLIDGTGAATLLPYARLYGNALRAAAGLRAAGVDRGVAVVVTTTRPAELLTGFWACVLAGALPLPVPPGGREETALAASAAGARLFLGDAPPGGLPPGLRPLGPVDGLHGGAGVPDSGALPDGTALLTLTSGSGGVPKAVPLTHRNVLGRARATALARGLDATSRTLNWMPLDHVSGIVMFHVRDVFLGCRQTHADTAWVREDPLRWMDLASTGRIDTTWAPNHAFARVAERLEDEPVERGWDLTRLRYVMNGGEAVKDRVARRFLAALAPYGLPPGALHPGWGMPETSSGVVDSVYTPHDGPPRRYVSVGVPHPGVAVRVVDEEGELLGRGDLGRVQVRGVPVAQHLMTGGRLRPAPLTDDGWLVTDDLGYVADGELTVTGRADDLIEAGGRRYHGHEIEEAVDRLGCVHPSFTVVRGYGPAPGGAAALAVFFRPRAGTDPEEAGRRVREHLRQHFGATVDHLEALAEDDLPRTPTGKLRRSALTARLPG